MKKQLLLAVTLAAMGLSACSSGQSSASPATSTAAVAESKESQAEAVEETAATAKSEPTKSNVAPFEEITAVDNDECSIKITGIDPDDIMGYALKTTLENKSTDKTYMFAVDNAAVDGVQADPFFASDVAPGKKANKEITFSSSALKKNGISDFTDIELIFRVYDSNDFSADPVAKETVHVYPQGEDKATTFKRAPQDTDNVIVDNDYATVIVTGYTKDKIMGYTVNLFLVNKTDNEAMFSVDNASVNGYMADPFFATSVMPGKCAFSSMSWSDSSLQENDIEEVKNIEFTLKIYNAEDIMAKPYTDEVITLNP